MVNIYPRFNDATYSEIFKIKINGNSAAAEALEELHTVSLCADEALAVLITIPQNITRLIARPASRSMAPAVKKNSVTIRITAPGYYWLEINDYPPLVFLVDSPQAIQPRSPKAKIFKPGIHDIGEYHLRDGEEVHLAAGAKVYGSFVGSPRGARITGAGVIDGSRLARPAKIIELVRACDVTIQGVTIRTGPCWTVTPMWSENIFFHSIKIISSGRNGDGIDVVASKNVDIRNCFFRCTDDCISLKTNVDPRFLSSAVSAAENHGNIENVTVSNCIMAGWKCSDGFTIGFEMKGEWVRNIKVRDCDILYARGGSACGGHSAFSIICDGPAHVSDVLFENIRTEEVLKNFELYITDGQYYTKSTPGKISNITLRNIHWQAQRPIMLRGLNSEHYINNVLFDACTIGSRALKKEDLPECDFVSNVIVK